jgi:hypothetical protein
MYISVSVCASFYVCVCVCMCVYGCVYVCVCVCKICMCGWVGGLVGVERQMYC